MKTRLVLFLAVILGVLLFATQVPTSVDVAPVPGPHLHVRLGLGVRFGGDYSMVVSMPKVGDEIGLDSETVPCELSFSIAKNDVIVHSQDADTMTRGSAIGWANTEQYQAGRAFHLDRGDYAVTIKGGNGCPTASTRGASVTVATVEREHILGSIVILLVASMLLVGGIAGLLVIEFQRRPRRGSN